MICYVIFGDFVGRDWGTPAILQQKHPWKIWIKIWDWQTPPSVGTKSQIFPMSLFEGSPNVLGELSSEELMSLETNVLWGTNVLHIFAESVQHFQDRGVKGSFHGGV